MSRLKEGSHPDSPVQIENRRWNEEYRKKRAEQLRRAKEMGQKEALNVEEVLRAAFGHGVEETKILERMRGNQTMIRSIEERYYLDSPTEVRNTSDYILWWTSRLEAELDLEVQKGL